jgi:hypothetical protein
VHFFDGALKKRLTQPEMGIMVQAYNLTNLGAEVGGFKSETSMNKSRRPYLENKVNAKELGHDLSGRELA